MPLIHRNTGAPARATAAPPSPERVRSGSTIWEDEAKEYWQEMEPVKRCRRLTWYLGVVVLLVLLGGGGLLGARVVLDLDAASLAALKARFSPLPAVVGAGSIITAESTIKPAVTVESTGSPSSSSQAAAKETPKKYLTSNELAKDPTAVDLLRTRCRVRGVQSRWHEETCRKLCMRDPHNTACMNGCSYGSITVTKLACDELGVAEIPTATRCPDGVSCAAACRAYDTEKPFPEMRNSCARGCSNIVPSACARSLQIYRELLQGSLQ